MTPLMALVGASGSGKTHLLRGVIKELTGRGLRVGVLKHHGHGGEPTAPAEAKDTDLFSQAGAARVGLIHAGGLWLMTGPEEAPSPVAAARRFFFSMDLVLAEGFKTSTADKIEVVAPGAEPLLPSGGRILALARRGGAGEEAGLRVLDADDPVAVADFILDRIHLATPAPERVSLKVDGVDLELNPFVASLVARTLRGLVAPLKGGEGGETIEVTLGS